MAERERPFAGCPGCRVPLVGTFEQPYKEFICMKCGKYWEFLQPVAITPTVEVNKQYEEALKRFKAGERPNVQA